MAFEGLSEKLSATFKRLRGKGRLTENDVREAMREVRLALLEADVGYKVVKEFVSTVTERAVGSDVLDSLTPAQQIIKIVNEELTGLMGGANAKISFASSGRFPSCRRKSPASFAVVVVLPAPWRPTIITTVGPLLAKEILALAPPMRLVSSSLTILIIC